MFGNVCYNFGSFLFNREETSPNSPEYKLENMNRFTIKKAFWLTAVFVSVFASTTLAQNPKPYLPPIVVKTDNTQPAPDASTQRRGRVVPSPTPLITKTGSSSSTSKSGSTMDVVSPVLDDVDIPGYSGILIEDEKGRVIKDHYSNYAFNLASNVKVITAYSVLKTFGPDYRFPTGVWTDGQIDRFNGLIIGNLYVSGRDPIFNLEHGIAIANELNALGIKQITGDLIVTDNFTMSFSDSNVRSANTLLAVMDASKRNTAANKAWMNYQVNAKKLGKVSAVPDLRFGGSAYVQTLPTNARLLFSHESAPLREIVKVCLSYSNNFLSHRLGDMLGGAYAVARVAQINAGFDPNEMVLATTSGLGINRVTPNAMMKTLRVLDAELKKNKMTFADIMPVAGIDDGTLKGRFNEPFVRGSIVGKTGTLPRTDGGVSALCGEINTKRGKLYFVIFNMKGGVGRFRSFQNSYVELVQALNGGAKPIKYDAPSHDSRLAQTRMVYPRISKE